MNTSSPLESCLVYVGYFMMTVIYFSQADVSHRISFLPSMCVFFKRIYLCKADLNVMKY